MRFAFYAAAVFVAALGSAGLPVPAAGAKGTLRPASLRIVFVDKAELARLHPGWQALNDMRAALAGSTSAGGGSMPKTLAVDDRHSALPGTGGGAGRTRSELVAKAAMDASAALDGLEARKYEALRARGAAMKAQLMKSAEADWKAEARNIEEAAAVETKRIDEHYSSDIVNARLRAAATGVESKVSQKADSGMDKTAVDGKLRGAQGELEGIRGAGEAEKNKITAEANARIDALKQASAKRVEEQVSAYESEQSKLIAGSMAAARGEIAQQLGPVSTPALFASRHENGGDSVADLNAAVVALQSRIQKDVSFMVLGLADSLGIRVTFERKGAGIRDATKQFAGLIKKRGWNIGASAMSGRGSS